MLYEKWYFWLLVVGVIMILISVIILHRYPADANWSWILFSLGLTVASFGGYGWLADSVRSKREAAIQSAILQAEKIGERRRLDM